LGRLLGELVRLLCGLRLLGCELGGGLLAGLRGSRARLCQGVLRLLEGGLGGARLLERVRLVGVARRLRGGVHRFGRALERLRALRAGLAQSLRQRLEPPLEGRGLLGLGGLRAPEQRTQLLELALRFLEALARLVGGLARVAALLRGALRLLERALRLLRDLRGGGVALARALELLEPLLARLPGGRAALLGR